MTKKLEEMKEQGLIEGQLPPKQCTGWIHNMVIIQKAWSPDQVRINIDTKQLNDYIIMRDIPIPTSDMLRHKLEGSDRFSTLDTRDAFYHFLLMEESQELFKFHGPNGVYKFQVLVMGTPQPSGECYHAMSIIQEGLKGVLVIKDNIIIHGEGQHTTRT